MHTWRFSAHLTGDGWQEPGPREETMGESKPVTGRGRATTGDRQQSAQLSRLLDELRARTTAGDGSVQDVWEELRDGSEQPADGAGTHDGSGAEGAAFGGPGERRRCPRTRVVDETKVKVNGAVEARLLDISPLGARLHVAGGLRPASTCTVALPLDAGWLRLRARVTRCRAMSMALTDGPLMFDAGLEFLDPDGQRAGVLERRFGTTPAEAWRSRSCG
jgi:hypothetical protein